MLACTCACSPSRMLLPPTPPSKSDVGVDLTAPGLFVRSEAASSTRPFFFFFIKLSLGGLELDLLCQAVNPGGCAGCSAAAAGALDTFISPTAGSAAADGVLFV